MYDLSGLYYEMKANGLIFGIFGVLSLLSSHFWRFKKEKVTDLILGLFLCILCVGTLGYHAYAIRNPQISVYEGEFIQENRNSPYRYRNKYCFSNEGGLKPTFYLDIFSKKKVYMDDFEKNTRYRIYYEARTEIIVKVEKLE